MTTQKYSNGDHSHALDEFSIETPQDMMTHNHTATMNHPPSMDLEDYDTNSTATSDEFVTHGRSRCWYFTLAAIVVVLVAVGGGVGVAMSGKDSNDQNNEVAAAQSGNGFGSTKDASGSANGAGSSFSGNNDYATSNVQSSQQYPGASSAPTSEVFDIIMSYARYHGLEFQNPDSYQSKAKNWVEQTALPGVHSPERLVQRYALACLYYATNGVSNRYTDDLFGVGVIRGWIDESGWLDADDECSWYRVSCNDNGQVTHIQLDSNRLTGSLPPELAILKDSLQEIDLYNNLIHNYGDEGNHWLGELTNIKKLFYGRTYFEYDGIPTVIGNLANLEEYDCSYTLYHGPLRGEAFANTNNLVYLYIGGNAFNTTIPSQLAQLPKLKYMYGEYADIKGDLSFIADMPEIKEIWMDRNPMITGTIPTEIGLASNLKSLSVTECGLTGTLPTELASLRLQQLWFYSNQLSGEIPSELGQVESLTRLGLENNTMVGTMPQEICDNRSPMGLLGKLEADCQDGGSVQCDCCTCCGPDCVGGASAGSRRLFFETN